MMKRNRRFHSAAMKLASGHRMLLLLAVLILFIVLAATKTSVPVDSRSNSGEVDSASGNTMLLATADKTHDSWPASSAHPEPTNGVVLSVTMEDSTVSIRIMTPEPLDSLNDKTACFDFSPWGTAEATGVANVKEGDSVTVSWWPHVEQNGALQGGHIYIN